MAAAAPTGCFKCGRPGHWSRDCPSSSNPNSNPSPNVSKPPFPNSKFSNRSNSNPGKDASGTAGATDSASKKKFNARPKLTPDMLLSEDGLGYVLKHFPKSFKYHGRGHEVTDLGKLIGLYAQWHSHLIPYYPFDQFIKKVEEVGATKRVRRCVNELCERVARGGDPTKFHESPVEEQPIQDFEPNGDNDGNGDAVHDPSLETPVGHDVHEDLFNEIYESTTTEPPRTFDEMNSEKRTEEADNNNNNNNNNKINNNNIDINNNNNNNDDDENNNGVKRAKLELSEEQKARMEANRLKAIERAKARALASQSSEIQS